MCDCTVLDLTDNDGGITHKQSGNIVDMMSPPPSAFCLLGSESSSTPAYAPPPPFQTELPASDGLMCGNIQKSFHWPGIDAVMESYQLYLEGNCSDHISCAIHFFIYLIFCPVFLVYSLLYMWCVSAFF